MSSEQTVRLVFLGEAGSALRAQDQVAAGSKKLASAEREQAAAHRQVATESRHAAQGMNQLERDLGRATRGAIVGTGVFRGMGRAVAFASGTFLGGYGLAYAVRTAFDEMQNAARVGAQTRQVILTTGSAAGVTAKQVDVLAQATMRKTGIDDEAIKTAENMLLTFTEVRNEVGKGNDIFSQATRLVTDMSVALGTDLRSAAIQVGKALQDPLTGLTALRRVGIVFNQEQRDQIRGFVESGQIVKAQKIILAELGREFGGTAAKANEATGGIGTLREELRNLAADYLHVLAPDIREAVKAGEQWVQHLETDKQAQKEFRDDVRGAADAVKEIAGVLRTATGAVGGTKNALELLVGLKIAGWAKGVLDSLTALTGAEAAAGAATAGTGLTGAAAAAGLLRSRILALTKLGAVTIPLTLVMKVKLPGFGQSEGDYLGSLEKRWQDFFTDPSMGITTGKGWSMFGKLIADTLLGTDFSKASKKYSGEQVPNPSGAGNVTRGQGLQIPQSFKPTHQTAGLAGFPAVDIMAKPGTPIKAPEDGHITRVSGHEPSEAPPQGQGGPWGLSLYFVGANTGNTYYMTHLMKVGEPGFYKKGAVIGIIGDYPGSSADHVHVGIHKGSSSEAYAPSSLLNPADFNLTPSGGGGGSTRRPPRSQTGATQLQRLQLALAQAGTTSGTGDDRKALQALIGFYRGKLANPNLPISQQIDFNTTLGGYIDQLASLDKTKKPSAASKSSLIVIKNTLAEVGKLVDQAGLEKKFGGQLDKINDLLDNKLVTTTTLAKIRIQLGKIADAAKTAIDKAKQQVEQRKQAFADAWSKLADDALQAFDEQTAAHVGGSRSQLNALIAEHDKAQVDQAVTDAKKALDDALAGKNAEADSDIVAQVRQLVGNSVLANAIDKAQADILGGPAAPISGDSLLAQLHQILGGNGTTVDPQAVADAQKAYQEALYQQKIFYLGLQADAEDEAYADSRAKLRAALAKQLEDWGVYFKNIGAKASEALPDLIASLGPFLRAAGVAQSAIDDLINRIRNIQNPSIPTPAPSTSTSGNTIGPPGVSTAILDKIEAGIIRQAPTGTAIGFAEGGDRLALSPTLLAVGEKGPERVRVTPVSQSGLAYGGDGGTTSHLIALSLGDPLDQLIESKVIALTPQISIAIGQDAAMRARSGRY